MKTSPEPSRAARATGRALTSALMLGAAVAATSLALDRTAAHAQSAEQQKIEEERRRRQGGNPPPQRQQQQQQQPPRQMPQVQTPQRSVPQQPVQRPALQQQQPPQQFTPPPGRNVQQAPITRNPPPTLPAQVTQPSDDNRQGRRFGRPDQRQTNTPPPVVGTPTPNTINPSSPAIGRQQPDRRIGNPSTPPAASGNAQQQGTPPPNAADGQADRRRPGDFGDRGRQSGSGDRERPGRIEDRDRPGRVEDGRRDFGDRNRPGRFDGGGRPPQIGFGPSGQVARPGTAIVGRTVRQSDGPTNITQFRNERVRSTDRGGRQIVQEPGNRTIIIQGNRRIIHRDHTAAMRRYYPDARSIPLRNGIVQTSYIRADGMRVFTETDRSGRIIRRFGRGQGGRDVVFIDNRRFYRNLAVGAGIAAIGVGVALALAPPAISMPRERYIVDYDRASDEDIYDALSSPPIERLERGYSLDEIRYNDTLRARMRRVDLDGITFETGSFDISEDQYPKLERMARAMARVIDRNPAETFLIEGHTDAVGDPEDNLSLSDHRAESVARVLTEHFAIPLENIVTQGYGEQYLKIDTDGPERRNRYVAVRRITPLLAQE